MTVRLAWRLVAGCTLAATVAAGLTDRMAGHDDRIALTALLASFWA